MKKYLITILLLALFLIANSQTNIAINKYVRASQTHNTTKTNNIVDGDINTAWNAGCFAPAWVSIDLKKKYSISEIKLIPSQSPSGNTTHEIFITSDMVNWTSIDKFTVYSVSKKEILRNYSPKLKNVKGVKILTSKSPSWIAWHEIEMYGDENLSNEHKSVTSTFTDSRDETIVLDKDELERKQESDLFHRAIGGTVADCNNYLNKYPSGDFVKEVRYRKLSIETELSNSERKAHEIKVSESEYTKFSKSAMKGDFDAVKEYINSGKQIDPDERINFLSALSAACYSFNYEIAEYLIQKGADVNIKYILDAGSVMTPLKIAAAINKTKSTNVKIVKLLLINDADPNIKFEDGATVVEYILSQGNISDLAPLLFEKNYNPNYLGNYEGSKIPPIALLVSNDNVEMVRYFVEHGAYYNIKVKSNGISQSLLDIAESVNASSSMINLLKSYGLTSYSSSNNQTQYITIGDVVNFFSSDDNPSTTSHNINCWDENSIKKWHLYKCGEHEYDVYKVLDKNGDAHYFYYWSHGSYGLCGGTNGYYEFNAVLPNEWLSKDRTTALKKLCGCN